ncbi:12279_t:CDS:1 [Entrophospora sp. SA101]|nr:12279_t:CDS:1 [Entrophospora sp. SA101]
MEHITAEYYRAGTPYLSPEALEEIIQSRGTVKNASKKMADKYYTSTRRIYEIWKRHAQGLPLRKQQMIHSQSTQIRSAISPENNTSDRQTKKRKSKSKSVHISDQPLINKDLDAVTSSLYETEKIGRISEAKKETILPATSQETEDVLELYKRNQKEIEKTRASGRTLASKLSVP